MLASAKARVCGKVPLVHGGYSLEVVPMVLDLGVSTDVLIPSFEVDGIGFLWFWLLVLNKA